MEGLAMVRRFNHVGLFLVLDGDPHGRNIVPMSVIALHRCLLTGVFVCSLPAGPETV